MPPLTVEDQLDLLAQIVETLQVQIEAHETALRGVASLLAEMSELTLRIDKRLRVMTGEVAQPRLELKN